MKSPISRTLSRPSVDFRSSANATSACACLTREALDAPWPSPWSASSPVPEPLDLKWFTMAMNADESCAPTFLKAWASGWRAFENAGSSRIFDAPTGAAAAFL